jgi:hypothetical protein
MSTLRVSNLQDTAGSNNSTPAAIANGIAKAWVNFNGTGTIAIGASYNVSSITDNGVGDYSVNFTTALADTSYAFSLDAQTASAGSAAYGYETWSTAVSTTSLRVRFTTNTNGGTTAADSSLFNVMVFR